MLVVVRRKVNWVEPIGENNQIKAVLECGHKRIMSYTVYKQFHSRSKTMLCFECSEYARKEEQHA